MGEKRKVLEEELEPLCCCEYTNIEGNHWMGKINLQTIVE